MSILEFDITIIRWINLFLVIGGIFYTYTVIRQLKSFWIGIPVLVWLFQSFLFYSIFLLYHYGYTGILIADAGILFPYWSTFSRLLGLITMFSYLYYIKNSCWRGNDL